MSDVSAKHLLLGTGAMCVLATVYFYKKKATVPFKVRRRRTLSLGGGGRAPQPRHLRPRLPDRHRPGRLAQVAYGLSWPTLGTGIMLSVQPERFQAQQVGQGRRAKCSSRARLRWPPQLAGCRPAARSTRLRCCRAQQGPGLLSTHALMPTPSPSPAPPLAPLQAMEDSGVLPQQEAQKRHEANAAAMEMIKRAAGQQR
jgi:hypothetical protein